MSVVLRHLLEGEPLPPGFDLDGALAADPQLRALAGELHAIDVAAAALPPMAPPPELVAGVLAAVAELEPVPVMPPSVVQAPTSPRPIPQRWLAAITGGLAVAAAAVVVLATALPAAQVQGNPDHMVPRGIEEHTGPGVSLRMSVDSGHGVDRFRCGTSYQPGETLLFRFDTAPRSWLHLVRIDDRGARVIHVEQAEVGTADLTTSGLRLGYDLEAGETAAVFALVRHDDKLDAEPLAAALAVGPDPVAVCATAVSLGAECAAERVEAVR